MKRIKACRVCNNPKIREVLDLGKQPFANSLPASPDEKESFYPLSISWCPECNLVQLNDTAEPADLFSNYVWVTSTSKVALEHSRHFYREVMSRTKDLKKSYVLEVASNDGAFLKPFAEDGYRVLGVDPARNITDMAIASGVPTRCEFFGIKSAEAILAEKDPAKVVIARNVLPHVANLTDFVAGLEKCLAKNGLLAIEFHYARVIYEGLHYDSIYHEHLHYFTLKSIENLLNRFNLFVTDITESPISGGSLILYVKKKKTEESPVVQTYRDSEAAAKVNDLSSWHDFARRTHKHRDELLKILSDITKQSGPVVGYGASARSSTLLNFCGIGRKLVSIIADQNPLKHGRYTAGTHIPIAAPEVALQQNHGCVLILAWNFADEISQILKNRFRFTGKCIIPLPQKPRVVNLG